jgi:hypothetical protein
VFFLPRDQKFNMSRKGNKLLLQNDHFYPLIDVDLTPIMLKNDEIALDRNH